MSGEKREAAAPLEWLAAAIGLIIFAGLFATIFAHGLERATAPDLVIEQDRMVATEAGTLVEFTIHNRSSRTAAAVVVEGRMPDPAGKDVTGQVTIDYVPAKTKVGGGLIFPGRIRGRTAEIRAVGYRRP